MSKPVSSTGRAMSSATLGDVQLELDVLDTGAKAARGSDVVGWSAPPATALAEAASEGQ